MPQLVDVPAEIWETIFTKLSPCSQKECQKVCKRWYLPAQRAFLEHIVLASCYDVEKFIACFTTYGTTASFNCVRTIRIGSTYTPPDRARHLLESNAIETLMHYFPRVLELVISGNCIELDYFLHPEIVNAMVEKWPYLNVFRVDSGWLHPDKRKIYLQTNYSLRQRISQLILYEHNDVTQEVGGLEAYLTSFPNLQKIKVISREICNLESSLPIIQHVQKLSELDVYVTREDLDHVFDRYVLNAKVDKEWLQQKLRCLHSLKITMATFCTFSIDFIIKYLLGLRQVMVSVNRVNVDEWTQLQKDAFSHGLLDFLCARKVFSCRSLQFNYNEENDYVNDILQKLYYQIPSDYVKHVDRHIHLILNNNSPESGVDYNNMFSNIRNFVFEIGSEIQQDKLVRTASFTHFIQHEGGLRSKSLKYLKHMDKVLDDITSLNFDNYGLCILTHLIPKIFQDTLQQFRFVKKVSVYLSRNYPKPSSFLAQDVTTVHTHLTHLEITAGNALCIEQNMLPLASAVFPSLKYLSLWFNCGWYNKNENEFIVDMAETQLERLNLDVTPIRVQTGRILKRAIELAKCFFILKVTTITKTVFYRISMDYLSAIELNATKQQEEQQVEYLTLHLIFKSINYVNLYLYRFFSDQFRPVSIMDPKDLIQTSICI